ncbi:MAG: hypothetical protein DRR42_24805, partial [Gammaproteobacteria bacterium]
MKSTMIFVALALFAQSTTAQLQPVLYDGDNNVIGNVVSIGPLGSGGLEYVDMVSLKGYRAKMSYGGPNRTEEKVAEDLPGFRAGRYFESDNCTGDPVMIPNVVLGGSNVILRSDLSNAQDLNLLSSAQSAGSNFYSWGDLLEYDGNSYYVPYDAERITIEVKSIGYFPGSCWTTDRCQKSDWTTFPYL